jgi:hypothetical protein
MVQVFTLYRDPNPADDHRAEYYSLSLYTKEPFQGLPLYIRESHGFWDGEQEKAILPQETLSPDEGYETAEEARQGFEKHLSNRAKDGFIHCYSKPNPWESIAYRIVQSQGS